MNRREYEYSSRCFRGLLKYLGEGDFRRRVKYRFGLQFNPMFGFYNLWDGLTDEHHLPQSIATIRLKEKTAIVRIAPEDFPFKEQLLKMRLPERDTIFVPSMNIRRHDQWVHNMLQPHVERRIQQRLAFLTRNPQEQNILTLQIIPPQPPSLSGQIVTSTVRIQFDSNSDLVLSRNTAQSMLHELVSSGILRLGTELVISYKDLEKIHNQSMITIQEQTSSFQQISVTSRIDLPYTTSIPELYYQQRELMQRTITEE